MKKFIITVDELTRFMGEEKYEEFNKYVRKTYKLKTDECFWLIGEIDRYSRCIYLS